MPDFFAFAAPGLAFPMNPGPPWCDLPIPQLLPGCQFALDPSWGNQFFTQDSALLLPVTTEAQPALGLRDTTSPTTKTATAASAATAFVLAPNQFGNLPGLQPNGASAVYTLANALSYAAQFTFYFVFKLTAAGQTVVLFGNSGAGDVIQLAAGTLTLTIAATAKTLTGLPNAAGTYILRVRRDVNNNTFAAWTGAAEQSIFPAFTGTLALNQVLGYGNGSVFNSLTTVIGAAIAFGADLVGVPQNQQYIDSQSKYYLSQRFGTAAF